MAEGGDVGIAGRRCRQDLERLAQGYALAALERSGLAAEAGGGERSGRSAAAAEGGEADQERLFGRLFGLLAEEAGVLERRATGGNWIGRRAGVGRPASKPGVPDDPVELAAGGTGSDRHPARSGRSWDCWRGAGPRWRTCCAAEGRPGGPAVRRGGSVGSGGSLSRGRRRCRVANRHARATVAAALVPQTCRTGERLSVLEVGAGTGSATVALLDALSGRAPRLYCSRTCRQDSSRQRRSSFGEESATSIQYRVLDIEAGPGECQGLRPVSTVRPGGRGERAARNART